MRKILVLLIAIMMGITPALIGRTPTVSHAAPAVPRTFIATLVAAPQSTDLSQPANLLVQDEDRTILVQVTGQTQLVNSNDAAIALADLHDGHRLQITGSFNGVQFFAARIRDLSLSSSVVLHIKGQVSPPQPSAGSNLLCVANAVLSIPSAPRANAQVAPPCPAVASDPSPLALYLTPDTRIRNASGGVASAGDLKAGDTVDVTAAFDGARATPLVVADLSLVAPVILHIRGQVSPPRPSAGSNLLCVANAVLSIPSAPRANAQVASPCPAVASDPSPLALYLTPDTRIRNAWGGSASLGDLNLGDALDVTARFDGATLVPLVVKDLSLQPSNVFISGTLVATPQPAGLAQLANLLVRSGNRMYLVQATGQTQLLDRNNASITLADLHDGDLVHVAGSRQGAQVLAARIRDLSVPPVTVGIQGTLAARPNNRLGLLCLRKAVTSGILSPQAAPRLGSACPFAQLAVYYTAGTRFTRGSDNGPIDVDDLRVGDSLKAIGALRGSFQFQATQVVDSSR